jgi:cell division transport system ATP-binding protein
MIIFDKVTKQFGDDTIGVEDVSFQIAPGELVTITGPSGSGKTTLMRLLTKEYEPTTGEIIFNETPLSQIKSGKVHQHRRNIGVIFQDYKLLRDLNVWENIALALDIIGMPQAEIEERVTDLLELVGLTDKAM